MEQESLRDSVEVAGSREDDEREEESEESETPSQKNIGPSRLGILLMVYGWEHRPHLYNKCKTFEKRFATFIGKALIRASFRAALPKSLSLYPPTVSPPSSDVGADCGQHGRVAL